MASLSAGLSSTTRTEPAFGTAIFGVAPMGTDLRLASSMHCCIAVGNTQGFLARCAAGAVASSGAIGVPRVCGVVAAVALDRARAGFIVVVAAVQRAYAQ